VFHYLWKKTEQLHISLTVTYSIRSTTNGCRNVKCLYVYDPIFVEVNSKLRILFGVRRRRKLIQRVIDSELGYDDNTCIHFIEGRGRSIVQVDNLLWEEMEW